MAPLLVLLAAATAALVWELWVCEGAHLGRRFVVWLYDLSAARYDGIKRFDPDWERRFLGEPVKRVVGGLPQARLLDIGAGTGRLGRALAGSGTLPGGLYAVEPARAMLARGRRLAPAHWVRAWAVPLPFRAGAFDLVASLEVLEFTPSPRRTLAEMIRVLRPGGWLLVTNRVGRQAPWILGRTFRRPQLRPLLAGLGLEEIEIFVWQVEYDLVWARKPDAGRA
jgi:ubiquinone/menaquinone biosynthesis C-methylase UbiE